MQQFADAAMIHAQQRHGIPLGVDAADVAAVDRILDREREQGEPRERPSLALCYGSWLGSLAVQELAAGVFAAGSLGVRWIGMHEPEPPRLQVAGVICSPIEAVARRLESSAAPPLAQRVAELREWLDSAPSIEAARAHNQQAWDRLASGTRFVHSGESERSLPDREAAEAAIDPWLRELPLAGRDLLCLASGGGTHGPLHARAGARVTVVDVSESALAIDRRLAEKHGLEIATVAASMEALSPLGDASFDAVLQPVSACYLPDVTGIYAEVARVLRDGGLYVVQHKQPASLQAADGETTGQYHLVHEAFSGRPVTRGDSGNPQHLEPGTVEFIHPLGALLGGLCQAGFVIEDVQEPPRADVWAEAGSPQRRACYLPPYLKLKARRLRR